MRTSPDERKRYRNLREIQNALDDNTLPSDIQQALKHLWIFIDNHDSLRLTTKKNYMVQARRILKRANLHPSKWTPDTIISIMNSYRRKKDGTEYVAQYRNQVRTVIAYILNTFDLKQLKNLVRDDGTKVGKIMKMQKIRDPVDIFEDDQFEKISEDHMRAVTSQMPSDRVRTLFWLMWDIGARVDDIKMMTLGDIEFDDDGPGMILWVPDDTKTGRRPTRPRYSLAHMKRYLSEHPYATRDNFGKFLQPDVALFVNTRGNAWSSSRSISKHLHDAVKKIRILEKDPEWPYPTLPRIMTCKQIRINAVNRDMDEGISIEANAVHHGHSVKVMMGVYRRRNRKIVIKREIDAAAGIVHETDSDGKEVWRTCPTCQYQNPPTNEFCAQCGSPVTIDAMRMKEEESKERERRIAKTVLDMLLEKSKEKGLLP